MASERKSSTHLVSQLVEGYLGNIATVEEKTAAMWYAKSELNSRKEDDVQDPHAVLFHLQRRCRADTRGEAALRIAEAAPKIPRAGPVLSLLGQLYGTGQPTGSGFHTTENSQSSRAEPEAVRPSRATGHGPPEGNRLTGRQAPPPDTERTMTVMVREVLYTCQAVNGKYLSLPADGDGPVQISPALKVRRPERQLMSKLSELGWLFKNLQRHTETSAIPDGPVRQAFMGALRQELADFYRLLATLETQANQPVPGKENKDPAGDSYLTLRRLTVWLGEPMVRIRWLATVAETVSNCSGGQLLAGLEVAAAHGQPLVRSVLTRCLRLTAAPFLAQLWAWIFQGRLQAPAGSISEFFVISKQHEIDRSEPGKMWREGYQISENMQPPSISHDLALKVLRAGKSLNFLRECCGDSEWALHSARQDLAEAANKLQYDQMDEVARLVSRATADIDKHVVSKLLTTFELGAHCEAIKRYLLLGQGDFIEALMDNVGNELVKPAKDISEFSMNGALDAALRASSAQYDPQDQLNRLRIKLETSQAQDEGWDVFTLKYSVEEPVATILDHTAMKSYLQLFKLAWALKRSEHSLNACWVDLNTVQRQVSAFPGFVKQTGAEAYSMNKVWEDLRMCHRLRNVMSQLVGSLQSYMMLEVIESAWTQLMTGLKTTNNLDGLIGAHEEYLRTLLRKLFLENPRVRPSVGVKAPNVQLELRKLLKVTLELRPKIGALADVVSSAYGKARMYIQDAIAREARGDWGRHEGLHPILGVPPLDLERVHHGLQKLDLIYGEQLNTFLNLLPPAAHPELRLLFFRLEAGAGGQGRSTEDGSRSTDDASSARRKLSLS